jgi:hypothetical protein
MSVLVAFASQISYYLYPFFIGLIGGPTGTESARGTLDRDWSLHEYEWKKCLSMIGVEH